MKLMYFRATAGNFGDDLNAVMWSELLPAGFFDDDDSELFLGIGSILWDHLPDAPRKIVAGSGWGGYTAAPNVHKGNWDILWVRGFRTAAELRLDPSAAITDAAVLMRRTSLPEPQAGVGAAFMPHVESMNRGDWKEVCRLAGVTFLDPRAPVHEVLAKLRGARVVVTEAMHGAIMADALRTPWIGVRPFHDLHRNKWLDWSESLEVDLRLHRLRPSSAMEFYTLATGKVGGGQRSRALLGSAPAAPVNAALRHLAARELLRVIERCEPQLSRDDRIESATARCEDALDQFIRRRLAAA